MKTIKESDIEDEVTVCPYCMNEVRHERLGCCGESSAHFQTAYLVDGELLLNTEVEIKKDEV